MPDARVPLSREQCGTGQWPVVSNRRVRCADQESEPERQRGASACERQRGAPAQPPQRPTSQRAETRRPHRQPAACPPWCVPDSRVPLSCVSSVAPANGRWLATVGSAVRAMPAAPRAAVSSFSDLKSDLPVPPPPRAPRVLPNVRACADRCLPRLLAGRVPLQLLRPRLLRRASQLSLVLPAEPHVSQLWSRYDDPGPRSLAALAGRCKGRVLCVVLRSL